MKHRERDGPCAAAFLPPRIRAAFPPERTDGLRLIFHSEERVKCAPLKVKSWRKRRAAAPGVSIAVRIPPDPGKLPGVFWLLEPLIMSDVACGLGTVCVRNQDCVTPGTKPSRRTRFHAGLGGTCAALTWIGAVLFRLNVDLVLRVEELLQKAPALPPLRVAEPGAGRVITC